jgi:peptidoglycan L-alanyl-D-glutamate endopeptidase CwlK
VSRRLTDLEAGTFTRCETLLQQARGAGFPLVVCQTLRTWEEQGALYQKGRTRPGPVVTFAKPGDSWHNYGRAFDVAFRVGQHGVSWDGPWEQVGEMGEQLGLVWGGRFTHPDCPHFEYHGDKTLAVLKQEQAEIRELLG